MTSGMALDTSLSELINNGSAMIYNETTTVLPLSFTSTPLPISTSQYSQARWIVGEVVLLLITLLTVYVFVALVYYSWRFRNMARVSGCGQERRERYLHYSCAAVMLMAIARCVLHQIVVFLPKGPGELLTACRTLMVAGKSVYNVAICLTYVHLWLRQRMFYTKPELKHLRTKVVEIFDWVVLVIIILTSAVVAFLTFIPLDGETAKITYHREKCSVFEYNSRVAMYFYAGLSCLYQLSLIALYVYPILMQIIHQKKEKPGSTKGSSNTGVAAYPALWSGIRRSFILTVAIIVTDAITGSLVWILTKKYIELLSSIIALNDINLTVNIICALCTFRNWRKIVFGFPVCRRMGWHHDEFQRSSRKSTPSHLMGLECEDEVDYDALKVKRNSDVTEHGATPKMNSV
ncbi:uncharacterized protein LOC120336559 [Styela clava]